MEFRKNINGIDVTAHYSQESIDRIFLPLLRRLTEMQAAKGGRLLVMLAAPPAAGKSTLAAFLEALSRSAEGITPLTAIGMDGFHRYQGWLLAHTLLRDGREIPMVDVKGTPETFDLEKLTAAVARVASGECCGWPDYDRLLHNPMEDARRVEGCIVLLEGNYLLLDAPGWRELHRYADYTIRILADEADLKTRLVDRKLASGTSPERALQFVEFSDLYNARLCLEHSLDADLTLQMTAQGEYRPGLTIRPTREDDLPRVMEIYAHARTFMAAHGNPNQWGPTNWPPEALIRQDIRQGKGRVCLNETGRVIASFFYDFGPDIEPTYREITGGSWKNDAPYGVVHRIAADGSRPGTGTFCLTWAIRRAGHLRIDTHGDNRVMQNLLEKLGFEKRGIIYVVEDHDPRFAYEIG